jgi:putative endonuclease
MKLSWIYILKCSDESYYCGSTSNLDQRINKYIFHKYSGYTSARLPIELVFSQEFGDINDVIRAETNQRLE